MLGRVEALAVVGDAQADAVRDPAELEPDLARAGVLDDVVERFLRDPVEDLLDRQRQALLERALDDDRQAEPALERGRMRAQGPASPSCSRLPGRSSKMSARISASASRWRSLSCAIWVRAASGPGRAASRPNARRESSRKAPG